LSGSGIGTSVVPAGTYGRQAPAAMKAGVRASVIVTSGVGTSGSSAATIPSVLDDRPWRG
jgi:hypothetical protein